MSHKYSARKDENYGYVLQKDGKDSSCPYQAPLAVPMQSSMGAINMNIIRMPCSTSCPKAKIVSYDKENPDNKKYVIMCGYERLIIDLEDDVASSKYSILTKL